MSQGVRDNDEAFRAESDELYNMRQMSNIRQNCVLAWKEVERAVEWTMADRL
jgi:hypothetical protein